MTLYRVGRGEIEPILSRRIQGSGGRGGGISEVDQVATPRPLDPSAPGLWVEKPHLCWPVVERIVKLEVKSVWWAVKDLGMRYRDINRTQI
jgi:hypothetical protein